MSDQIKNIFKFTKLIRIITVTMLVLIPITFLATLISLMIISTTSSGIYLLTIFIYILSIASLILSVSLIILAILLIIDVVNENIKNTEIGKKAKSLAILIFVMFGIWLFNLIFSFIPGVAYIIISLICSVAQFVLLIICAIQSKKIIKDNNGTSENNQFNFNDTSTTVSF